jgi:TRAP-type C4-dicarboxylate transport system permease small subunit
MTGDVGSAAATETGSGEKTSRISHFTVGLALLGGALSIGLALMVVVSVTLRSSLFNMSGIPGDFELAQMLTAVSVFCFLPLCQDKRGHVIVDAASQGWREIWRRRVDGIWEIVSALAMGLLAWQLAQGALGMGQTNTRSMVLALPIAPAVWMCSLLCAVLAIVAFIRGIENLRWRSPGSEA